MRCELCGSYVGEKCQLQQLCFYGCLKCVRDLNDKIDVIILPLVNATKQKIRDQETKQTYEKVNAKVDEFNPTNRG